jgi:hypothetical protein
MVYFTVDTRHVPQGTAAEEVTKVQLKRRDCARF